MTPGQRTEKHSGRKRKATVDGDSPGKEPPLHLTTKKWETITKFLKLNKMTAEK